MLGRGGALPAASQAATAAAEVVVREESAASANGASAEVDEFGRSIRGAQERELEQAAARRGALLQEQQRRLQVAAAGGRLALDAADVPEGGDEEAAVQEARYERRKGEIMEAASTVFAGERICLLCY